MDLFPESFREPGILILRPTPVEDTGRNPALCECRGPEQSYRSAIGFAERIVKELRWSVGTRSAPQAAVSWRL